MGARAEDRKTLHRLREELAAAGREREAAALDALLGTPAEGEEQFLKLRKRWYTPAEVAERVGVSRQTVVKWIERGELDAELTPGGHHRIPASAFTSRRGAADRGDLRLVPVRR
jgi:excisionase family DNA binding protein